MDEEWHGFHTDGGKVMGRMAAARRRAQDDPSLDQEQASFALRRQFGRFTAEDGELLTELRPTLEREAPQLVEQFYEHLQKYEPLQRLLSDPATVARLKRSQREYLVSLTAGRYDDRYSGSRLAIGRVHERIGLEPQWYLGTYGFYLDILEPVIRGHFASDARKALRAQTALSKLLILDMQVVLDAYYETRHRKALERSEQLAAVGELAASIAHEVRNPLAGMKGALEVLRSELAVKPSNLEIVDELLAQIVRLEGLVRDLLTYGSPRALSRQLFDLHELLDRLLRLYKEAADRTGITIHRVYGPGTGQLSGDLAQLEQVFLNLIHNAVQAMEEEGGTLSVSTRLDDGALVISLEDSGKGIQPPDLGRIFQPFFTTKHRGSGLGLSIVRKIVESHGGSIEVRSAVGHGTVVTVRVPTGEAI